MFPLRTLHLFPSLGGLLFFPQGRQREMDLGERGSGGGETEGVGGWVNCSWNEIYEITKPVHFINISTLCICEYMDTHMHI